MEGEQRMEACDSRLRDGNAALRPNSSGVGRVCVGCRGRCWWQRLICVPIKTQLIPSPLPVMTPGPLLPQVDKPACRAQEHVTSGVCRAVSQLWVFCLTWHLGLESGSGFVFWKRLWPGMWSERAFPRQAVNGRHTVSGLVSSAGPAPRPGFSHESLVPCLGEMC